MTDIKRVRYFQNEFLDTEDFRLEQGYHRDMRRRHNQVFHSWGIGFGLEVTTAEGLPLGQATRITITTGMALDGEGREIVLTQSRELDFNQPRFTAGQDYYIVTRYHEQESPPIQEEEPKEYKRWAEAPEIDAFAAQPQPPEMNIVLARVTLGTGKAVTAIDHSMRKYAALDRHVHGAQDVGALPVTGGTLNGDLHVLGTLIGAAKDESGKTLKIRCGKTPEGHTNWVGMDNGVNVVVTVPAFESVPLYFVNVHGDNGNWMLTGGSSAYDRTNTGFRVYVYYPHGTINPTLANGYGWHVQWLAIGI
jgi:hypothetical protein